MRHALNVLDRAFGEAPAKKINGEDLKGWLATTDWPVKTRNNMMGYWKNAFGIGKDLKLVNENPLIGLKSFKNTKATDVRVISVPDMEKLLSVMPDEAMPFFAIGAFAGVRLFGKELRGMRYACALNRKRVIAN